VKEEIWYVSNISGGVTHAVTATLTGGAESITLAIHEYSGVAVSSPLDVTSTNIDTTLCSYTSGSATTNFTTELLIGGHVSDLKSEVSFTPDAGWTKRIYQGNPSGAVLETQDRVVASGTYQSSGTADQCGYLYSVMATFKEGRGVQVSPRSDTLSGSRPSATSNHTVVFKTNTAVYGSSISGSSTVTIGLPSAFTIPVGMDCGDVDAATSVQFSFNYPACQATATAWGFSATGSVIVLTPPSGTTVYVPTSTQVTINIGSNATVGQQGAHWITNPSSAGVYTISVGGTFGGSGNMLVAIQSAVTVQVSIPESLAFTVSSVAAVNCTANDGASVTAVDTSPTSVSLGTFPVNTFSIGCQDLVVSTNAGAGYSLTTQETSAMSTVDGRFIIPDTTCDAGSCSESVAGTWTDATKNGFGHTCFNQDNNQNCNAAYSNGTNFRQFANIAGGEAPQAIMSSSTPASVTARIKFRLSVGAQQVAGMYKTQILYIINGTF
jgi:hypothetical protein